MKLELLVLAIAPVVTIILWIYLKDKYDKEPVITLSKFFILGILEKMNFSDADKSWLIKECCFDDYEEVEDDNPIYKIYLEVFQ
jgi:hypothetical protein